MHFDSLVCLWQMPLDRNLLSKRLSADRSMPNRTPDKSIQSPQHAQHGHVNRISFPPSKPNKKAVSNNQYLASDLGRANSKPSAPGNRAHQEPVGHRVHTEAPGTEQVLNWNLSSVDFEIPARFQFLASCDREPGESSVRADTCSDSTPGGQAVSQSFDQSKEMAIPAGFSPPKHQAAMRNGKDVRTSPQHNVKAASPMCKDEQVASPQVTSVELSVPITQFLSTFDFLTAPRSPIRKRASDAASLFAYLPLDFQKSSLRRRVVLRTCADLLEDWRYIAFQRRKLRKTLQLTDSLQLDQSTFVDVIQVGQCRRLEHALLVLQLHAARGRCTKCLCRQMDQALRGCCLRWWRLSCIEAREASGVEAELQLLHAIHSVHRATVRGPTAGPAVYAAAQRAPLLLRAAMRWRSGRSGARAPDVGVIGALSRWKDVVRDSKLLKLHRRIHEVEAYVSSIGKDDGGFATGAGGPGDAPRPLPLAPAQNATQVSLPPSLPPFLPPSLFLSLSICLFPYMERERVFTSNVIMAPRP